jgi:branched-chain amino acid aminotransferase
MLTPTEKIWHNGRFINWDDAKIHVLSHVVSYGSSVFEGIRCYETCSGPSIFRLREHIRRMVDSAKVYRMEIPFGIDELAEVMLELVRVNKMKSCYIRPIALRGYGEIGVNPKGSPIEVYMANFPWGKYIPGTGGADVCISSWNRLAPNTMPALAKAGANYMNSQLIHMEAEVNGYAEGIGLDVNGLVSEGSGENVFIVRNGVLFTPPLANSALSGITRDSVLTIARHLGLTVTEQALPRELLYIADEVFFTGTAAEVSPIRSIDRIVVGDGKPGEITKSIAEEFFGIANGLKPDRFGWLTPVNVKTEEPVTA